MSSTYDVYCQTHVADIHHHIVFVVQGVVSHKGELEQRVGDLSTVVAETSSELLKMQDKLQQGKLMEIIDTKANKRVYSLESIQGVNEIVVDFDLKGKRIDELLRRTLALFTGKSVDEIKAQVPIMGKSQMYLHASAYSRLKKSQLSRQMSNPDRDLIYPFYSMEADGGEISRQHRVMLLMCHADKNSGVPIRLHVAAPITPSSAAEYDAEAITSTAEVRVEHTWGSRLVLIVVPSHYLLIQNFAVENCCCRTIIGGWSTYCGWYQIARPQWRVHGRSRRAGNNSG